MGVAYQTALHIVLKMRNASMAKLLLDLGASLDIYVQRPRDENSSSASDEDVHLEDFEDERRTFISQRIPVHDSPWRELDLCGDPSLEEFDVIELGRPSDYDLAIFTNYRGLERAKVTLELLTQHDATPFAWRAANDFTSLHCTAFSGLDASVIKVLLKYMSVNVVDPDGTRISFICQLFRHMSNAFGGDDGLASFLRRLLQHLPE